MAKIILPDPRAKRVFTITLLSVFIIFFLSFFVYNLSMKRTAVKPSRHFIATHFSRAVQALQIVPPEQLKDNLQLFSPRFISLKLVNNIGPQMHLLKNVEPAKLYKYAAKHYPKIQVALTLTDGQWVIITYKALTFSWLSLELWFVFAIALIAILLLIGWSVRSLTVPIHDFAQAVHRFGADINAPPLALQGSSQMCELIDSFNSMQARIRRLLADRTQMLVAISHDLRTPITRLQLRAEYLKDTGQYEKALADLNEMDQMISSILSFARDYATTESREKFDLTALIESLCDDLLDMGQSVNFTSEIDRLPYWGHVSALRRAISNLVENGVKYGSQVNVFLSRQEKTVYK